MYIIEHQAFCYNMIWLLPTPHFSPSPISKLSSFVVFLCVAGELGEGGWLRSQTVYDGEIAWYSILKLPAYSFLAAELRDPAGVPS